MEEKERAALLLCQAKREHSRLAPHELQKILKELEIADHSTCLLRNLYTGQEAIVRTTNWFKTGERVCQGCVLSPCCLMYIQSTSCKMPGWMKHKLELRSQGEIAVTSDMQMIPL